MTYDISLVNEERALKIPGLQVIFCPGCGVRCFFSKMKDGSNKLMDFNFF